TGVWGLRLVAVALQAPPGAGATTCTVFPIVGQKFSLFAAHAPLLVTVTPSAYRTESAKNPSCAVTTFRRSDFIEATYAFALVLAKAYVASMKSDLRNVVTAQEGFFEAT